MGKGAKGEGTSEHSTVGGQRNTRTRGSVESKVQVVSRGVSSLYLHPNSTQTFPSRKRARGGQYKTSCTPGTFLTTTFFRSDHISILPCSFLFSLWECFSTSVHPLSVSPAIFLSTSEFGRGSRAPFPAVFSSSPKSTREYIFNLARLLSSSSHSDHSSLLWWGDIWNRVESRKPGCFGGGNRGTSLIVGITLTSSEARQTHWSSIPLFCLFVMGWRPNLPGIWDDEGYRQSRSIVTGP